MQAYNNDHTTRMHYEIESMTRRLELEKRRLERVVKEAAAVRKTLEAKKLTTGFPGRLPRTLRAKSARAARALNDQPAGNGPTAAGEETPISPASRKTEPNGGSSTFRASNVLSSSPAPPPQPPTQLPMNLLRDKFLADTKRLDESNLENERLKQEVDSCRRDLLQLTSLFEKLKGDVKKRTGQLMATAEEARNSKNILRDAAQRLHIMKAQQERERTEFKTEVKTLRDQLIQHEWRRKEVEVSLRRGDHMGIPIQTKQDLLRPEEENGFSEFDMAQRVLKTAFLNCIQRRHMKQHQKNIEVYDQAFATIKQSTGIERIEDIVKVFMTLENRNYSLMTYVNHMNKEIDALQSARAEHERTNLEDEESRQQRRNHRSEVLTQIRKEHELVDAAIGKEKAICDRTTELLASLEKPVQDMVARIEAEATELLKMNAVSSAPSAIATLPTLPSKFKEESIPAYLDWVESAMRRWRDCLNDPMASQPGAAFPSTARSQVMLLPPKRHHAHGHGAATGQAPLVKPQELPTSVSMHHHHHHHGQEQRSDDPQRRTPMSMGHIDDESEDEDWSDRPLSFKDLRHKAEQAALKKRRKHHTHRVRHETLGHSARFDVPKALTLSAKESDGRSGSKERPSGLWTSSNASGAASSDDDDLRSQRMGSKGSTSSRQKPPRHRAPGDEGVSTTAGVLGEVSELELNDVFLQHYDTMSRDELQVVADRLGMSLRQLCQIKQEFDQYDEDQSGRIDINELRSLLVKLIEDPSEEEIQQAFKELDMDGSGEIEFFEFVEWFKGAEQS